MALVLSGGHLTLSQNRLTLGWINSDHVLCLALLKLSLEMFFQIFTWIFSSLLSFPGMLQRLPIQDENDIQRLSEVPSMVFNDGITNWGRIVTLISFGAFVAKHLKIIKLEHCTRQLADNFADYLMTQKREWIVQHNGWVSICAIAELLLDLWRMGISRIQTMGRWHILEMWQTF